ncbi:MAG: Transmembrane transcriptional regulator (anti-sigma factor RsiW) [Chloroflexi bacterium AL-W]|nr:Transmembrane transcriptional regulator (anti-sigma factor RsiW) [Chloroflexi bacterium AL-N1]NOK69724.1 Transmembrane transcriptional regulator (anti-sigma factor RsiW) [Chloroflexi bacterium AL-N10]NOK73672.1 Transmembrane transcriptional regulator (anti-sigma factor RsiW) [Chloroflexi bacterium AL-N5]NOK83894.1 Transmembrane transcriptional regulator (anti-sigma factor RsiW) [Chloroflexi bacterium AL-W]NOK88003.1 Transmembrane transcriptional regulator (anti-sigma factor RsiW) [Chloroflex
MMDCKEIREYITLEPNDERVEIQTHLLQCTSCADYRRRQHSLDVVLQAEMRWETPADLTARLLNIAANPALLANPTVMLQPRPKGWHVVLVYTVTIMAVILSIAMGVQIFGLLATQIGLQSTIDQLVIWPSQAVAQLIQVLPESRYVIDFFLQARTYLLWLLCVAVVWAVLDRWTPQMSSGRSQVQA